MISTYLKNGNTFSRFNPGDHKKYDKKGKHFICSLLSEFPQHVSSCEMLEPESDKGVDYDVPDLKIIPNNKDCDIKRPDFYIEVEIKNSGWDLIMNCIHIPLRKKRYLSSKKLMYFVLIKSDLTEFIAIPNMIFRIALEVKGTGGYGKVKPTEDFVMPDHKCYMLKKYTRRDLYSVPEDFVNIDYSRLYHYVLHNDKIDKINGPGRIFFCRLCHNDN